MTDEEYFKQFIIAAAVVWILFILSSYAWAGEICTASRYDTSESRWGRETASGVPLNDHKPTVAHKSWTLRGWMKITNLKTGHVEVLQVIDRGPFVKGRCVDLSVEADRRLGCHGLCVVKLEHAEK